MQQVSLVRPPDPQLLIEALLRAVLLLLQAQLLGQPIRQPCTGPGSWYKWGRSEDPGGRAETTPGSSTGHKGSVLPRRGVLIGARVACAENWKDQVAAG